MLAILFLIAASLSAAIFGNSSEDALSTGIIANIEISEIDTKTLKLEHCGGDSINFSEDIKIHFYHKDVDYELFYPYRTGLLTAGDTRKLYLYDIVDLKAGDSAVVSISDEEKKTLIYRNRIYFQKEHTVQTDELASVEEISLQLRKNNGKLYIMFQNPTEKKFYFGSSGNPTVCRITSSGYTFEVNNKWLYDYLYPHNFTGGSPDQTDIYHFGYLGGNKGIQPSNPGDSRAVQEIQKIINGDSSPIYIYLGSPEGEIGRAYRTPVPYKSKPTNAWDHDCY